MRASAFFSGRSFNGRVEPAAPGKQSPAARLIDAESDDLFDGEFRDDPANECPEETKEA